MWLCRVIRRTDPVRTSTEGDLEGSVRGLIRSLRELPFLCPASRLGFVLVSC